MTQSQDNGTNFENEATSHMEALYRFALSLTSDPTSASDLVQETYLKAFRFRSSFQSGTNMKAWLFQILKNSFINTYRRKKRSPVTASYENVADFYGLVKSDGINLDTLSKQLFEHAFDDEITRALDSLSEDFRMVLVLSDIEDFTYEEISEVLEVPIGTVRSRLHRARRSLRSILYSYAKERGISGSNT